MPFFGPACRFVRRHFATCSAAFCTGDDGMFFRFVLSGVQKCLALTAGFALNPVVGVNEVDRTVAGT